MCDSAVLSSSAGGEAVSGDSGRPGRQDKRREIQANGKTRSGKQGKIGFQCIRASIH